MTIASPRRPARRHGPRGPDRLRVAGERVALMWHLNLFDAQILAQNLIEGANSFTLWRCRSSWWPARS